MAMINDLASDAELIVNYSLTNKVPLPPGCVAILLAAKGQIAALAVPGKTRDDFYGALDTAAATLAVSVASIRASGSRRDRLRALVADAQRLLEFAAANAKKVDDDIRNPLIAAADSVAKGAPTVTDEQSFLKAYEALTTKTAPVTADTLEASKTKLPEFAAFFSRHSFENALRGLTLGRFVNALVFVFILLITCVSLGYYSLGSTGLSRYRELHTSLEKLESELPQKKDLVALRDSAVKKEQANSKVDPAALDTANRNLRETQHLVYLDELSISQFRSEHDAIPERLWKWSQQPCSTGASYVFAWTLCSAVDKIPDGEKPSSDTAKLEAAKTVAARMSDIYLPLLLGWLGAYAFILRNMTKEISENSFAKSSALRHIVRLGLGALAGFASTWLLTPETVGGVQLKNVPAWALAFIAGYGIELVFSFMDRIIGAFTTKTT